MTTVEIRGERGLRRSTFVPAPRSPLRVTAVSTLFVSVPAGLAAASTLVALILL